MAYAVEIVYPRAIASRDYTRASGLLDRLAWVGRDSAEYRFDVARAWRREEALRPAEAQIARGVELRPSLEELIVLAAVRESLGDAAGMADALEAALALRPDDPELLFRVGRAHLDAGDPQRALERLERMAELAPAHPQLAEQLAIARRRLVPSVTVAP